MASRLESLHAELVELIVQRLELSDIASLRLTSRIVEAKASGGCFRHFFAHKKVDLMTAALRDFVRATGSGRLGCLLRHCAVTGIIRPDKVAAPEQSVEHVRLLAEAFRNLKQRSPQRTLASLSLSLVVRAEGVEGGGLEAPGEFRAWRDVWDAALRTFSVTMAALRESQLPVTEHLELFGGLRGCSLASDAFLASASELASGGVFASLKRLTASLSVPRQALPERFPYENGSDSDEEPPAQTPDKYRPGERIIQGISRVLPAMGQLESLDLHWYTLGEVRDMNPDATFVSPAPSPTHEGSSRTGAALPHLKDCTLRGIYVSENNLLQFLKAVRPAVVTLEYVHLISGTWASVFQYMTSPDNPVACYSLDDLKEIVDGAFRLVHFEVPGSSKFRYHGEVLGPSSLARQASCDVKEAIHYRFMRWRPLGSGEYYRWRRSKFEEFGGPRNHRYDFIELNWPKVVVMSDDSDGDLSVL